MLTLRTPFAAAALLTMICLGAAPARASPPVTYVSGKGNDSGDCSSPAKPCRTFQFAVNQTIAGGEVKALDPADYSPVTINKPISITGVDGAGIDTKGGVAITLNHPPNSTINLANLLIQNVSGSGTIGISAGGAGGLTLTITHCTVRGFTAGIVLGGGQNTFLIADTVVTKNHTGINATFSIGILDHVIMDLNTDGARIGRALLTAVDTNVSNNSGTGLFAGEGGFLLAHSTVTGNSTGIDVSSLFGTARSFGDNHIYSNGTDVKGTLTNVHTQ